MLMEYGFMISLTTIVLGVAVIVYLDIRNSRFINCSAGEPLQIIEEELGTPITGPSRETFDVFGRMPRLLERSIVKRLLKITTVKRDGSRESRIDETLKEVLLYPVIEKVANEFYIEFPESVHIGTIHKHSKVIISQMAKVGITTHESYSSEVLHFSETGYSKGRGLVLHLKPNLP